jgi:hypothetical protein
MAVPVAAGPVAGRGGGRGDWNLGRHHTLDLLRCSNLSIVLIGSPRKNEPKIA